MTRKDYILIAEALKRTHYLIDQTPSGDDWVEAERHIVVEATAKHLADALAADNRAFDRERFLAAAKP
jgi:hypothetical protein